MNGTLMLSEVREEGEEGNTSTAKPLVHWPWPPRNTKWNEALTHSLTHSPAVDFFVDKVVVGQDALGRGRQAGSALSV